MKNIQVGVIGSAGPEEYPYDKPGKRMFVAAEKIGRLLGQNDCIVVNGGKGGIMEAVSRGAKSVGAITIAEIAGDARGQSNEYVDVEIVTTDIGFRGPSLLIGMSDVVISLGGGAGTLQEIAVAYRMQKPIVLLTGFGGWTDRLAAMEYMDERRLIKFMRASNVDQAVRLALETQKEISL